MTQKTIITNGKFVTPLGVKHGDLEIVDGKIVSIAEKLQTQKSDLVFDAGNRYVLPGLIETHGHFREPGFEHKEDIVHGTRAALAGGFTTVFDMPNTKPPITAVLLLKDQIARYKEKSYCDFAINFGSAVENILELEIVDPRDITGVKVFTAGHQTTPTTIPKLSDQAKIWEIAARRGFPVLVYPSSSGLQLI
ncbi:dihydroorotase family protein [Candidatus Gottesmanbacteria bacterium]|nr:dihydroorotase family protein [Candidatus Gottesmanbacteria bacterium]